METSSQLVVFLWPDELDESVRLDQPILGLPLIRRMVLSAKRAGFDNIWVAVREDREVTKILEGTTVEFKSLDATLDLAGFRRIVFMVGGVLPDATWLKTLLETPLKPDRLYCDTGVAAAIETKKSLKLFPSTRYGRSEEDLGLVFDREIETELLEVDHQGRTLIPSGAGIDKAESWLLERLIKKSDSLIARHFHRRISLAISRHLVSTPISPNLWTIFSVGIGLSSSPYFLSARAIDQFTGALLFLIHAIIDGCDGELARLRFQESRIGMKLDLWGDNLVHSAVFFCMGIGWWIGNQGKWPLLVTAIAIAGVLWTAWLVYRKSVFWARTEIPSFSSVVRTRSSRISKIMDALGNRDFIYLILLLSVFGKVYWILPLTAVGSPIFALVLLYLGRREGEK
ncbi:MAG: Bifunctional IPC transferase and DIPP synthase [Candidatus Moanabacter tarae]|uniref:Bifunctional IPC transferase and DIPP synthase n=1 Tax=Candidatus Moanibacter tarae TaxID=2200854 RepID=A0A2Z4AD57_9BACT|nr:MAG: Bifunctional IPC transferase and DIPP synthase [Candidatus Moanabacter tarae]|tara:strand:+ start:8663 stop:9859 length:1197 start_codon:yes stop_codon:yes gene_type:complete